MAVPRAAAAPAAPSSLPDPHGSPLEVSFRRLLESCLAHLQTLEACPGGAAATATAATVSSSGGGGGGGGDAAAGASSGGDAAAAATSPGGGGNDDDTAARVLKMRHYVDTLREMMGDLRTQQDSLGLDAATLDLYDTHVKAVAAAVPKVQLPPYCQGLITGSAVAPGGGGSRPAPNLSYFTPPPARPGVNPAGGGSDRGGPSGRVGAEVAGLSAAASERLREAEAAQALLTDELVGLTAALKANALGMAGAVADRGRLLDATDAALSDSLAATKKNAAAAGQQVKRSGGNLCFTCAVLLVVGLAFTAMVVYIKLTHLIGYRAPTSPTTASPSSNAEPLAFGAGAGGWLGSAGGGGGGGGGWGDAEGVPGQSYGGGGEPWQGHGGEL